MYLDNADAGSYEYGRVYITNIFPLISIDVALSLPITLSIIKIRNYYKIKINWLWI